MCNLSFSNNAGLAPTLQVSIRRSPSAALPPDTYPLQHQLPAVRLPLPKARGCGQTPDTVAFGFFHLSAFNLAIWLNED